MKLARVLQRTQQLADYSIQLGTELDASLPRSSVYRLAHAGAAKELHLLGWNGGERRLSNDRRARDRRNERQLAMLDTRAGLDRRQSGRRDTDEIELRSFSCRI